MQNKDAFGHKIGRLANPIEVSGFGSERIPDPTVVGLSERQLNRLRLTFLTKIPWFLNIMITDLGLDLRNSDLTKVADTGFRVSKRLSFYDKTMLFQYLYSAGSVL